MPKLKPENRMITKCEICTYEMDTLEDDMFVSDTKEILCVLCYEDKEYD